MPIRAVLRHRRLVGGVAGGTAAVLAALWLFVVPQKADEVAGIQRALIQYGHSLCWVLLSAAAFLYAAQAPRRFIETAAWSALAAYIAFLLALVL